MSKEKIIKVSNEILDYLLAFKDKNPDFTFSLRSRDSVQSKELRLEAGQWFQGSNYIYVPLFKKGDGARKVKTIGFVISFNDDGTINNYIEVSFKGGITSANEIAFHEEFAKEIGLEFPPNQKHNVKHFENPKDYLNNLLDFISNKRNIALNLLDKFKLKNKYVISEIDFQKNLARINSIKRNLENRQPSIINKMSNIKNPIPLNQILYGPPGTGKTYHTINKALAIIEGKSEKELEKEERSNLKERFNEYVKSEQIVFTTFHQSMSYEDFVEGIKPLKPETDDTFVKYEVQDGIFKRIAIKASEKEMKKDNFDEVFDSLLKEINGSKSQNLILETLVHAKEFTIYKNSKGNLKFHANTEKAYEGVIKKEIISHYLRTGEALDWSSYTKSVAQYLIETYNYSKVEIDQIGKPYVLIIDEINRGNVSQIFGELITLLEEDKRTGKNQTESLNITLPYSKKIFSVPKNLYIIGTMNTADRSVEALDSALRRRFSFVEMLPNENHEHIGTVEGLFLGTILEKINKRLERLLSRNHTIGHSFFMNVTSSQSLYNAFYDKIVPLLQEYFFGDYGKIGLVLGKAFVKDITSIESEDDFFAPFEYDEKDILFEKKIYRINKFKEEDGINYLNFLESVKAI